MASVLQEKSKAFALHIMKVCNENKRSKRESVLTNQLVSSGTVPGSETDTDSFFQLCKEQPVIICIKREHNI